MSVVRPCVLNAGMRMADGTELKCQTTVVAAGTFRTSMATFSALAADTAAIMEEIVITTGIAIMTGIATTIAMETAVMGPGVHIPRPARTLP